MNDAGPDHLTVKWLTRGGHTRWQPRAIDGTVANRHFIRALVLASGGHAGGGFTVWESPGPNAHLNSKKAPDGCWPILYRWRWRARLKARLRNRRLAREPSSYHLDSVWHEVRR